MANVDLKNPALHKMVLGVVLAGAIGVLFFVPHFLSFGYRVQQEKIQALRADFERKSTDLARARTTVADLPRFEAEYHQLHDQWALAAELLPTDRDLPALLRKITLAGEQTGVTFVMFRPMSPKSDTYYSEMPFQISVQGGYHQVGSFLAELANLRRIVTVSSVRLKTSGVADNITTTAAEFSASAYSLNTTPAPATTTAPNAPAAAGSGSAPVPTQVAAPKGGTHARKS